MKHAGFTLIELMLATTLTVLLMAGVLSVVTSLQKPLPALEGEGEATAVGDLVDAVVAVIEADLLQAIRLETHAGGLEMMSYAGLDPQTLGRTQRPTIIRYVSHEIEGSAWLIREQAPLDTTRRLPLRRELVASGYSRIELLPPPEWIPVSLRGGGDIDADAIDKQADRPPVEGLWRLRLWSPGSDQPVVDRQLLLRRDLNAEQEGGRDEGRR